MAGTKDVVSELEQRRYILTTSFSFYGVTTALYSILRHFSLSTVAISAKYLCTATTYLRPTCIYHKAESACTNIHYYD